MKKLIIALLIIGSVTGCTRFNMHQGSTTIESMENKEGVMCKYVVHDLLYFSDTCNKFKVGDTLYISNKQ
jgi:hypothetical protein